MGSNAWQGWSRIAEGLQLYQGRMTTARLFVRDGARSLVGRIKGRLPAAVVGRFPAYPRRILLRFLDSPLESATERNQLCRSWCRNGLSPVRRSMAAS